jgi:hypothetical protein
VKKKRKRIDCPFDKEFSFNYHDDEAFDYAYRGACRFSHFWQVFQACWEPLVYVPIPLEFPLNDDAVPCERQSPAEVLTPNFPTHPELFYDDWIDQSMGISMREYYS